VPGSAWQRNKALPSYRNQIRKVLVAVEFLQLRQVLEQPGEPPDLISRLPQDLLGGGFRDSPQDLLDDLPGFVLH
jgi:hypothetical protein